MHFLEDHAVPYILKWRTGFSFLGEQGGEAVHAAFNSLQRIYNNTSKLKISNKNYKGLGTTEKEKKQEETQMGR